MGAVHIPLDNTRLRSEGQLSMACAGGLSSKGPLFSCDAQVEKGNSPEGRSNLDVRHGNAHLLRVQEQ